ncbi:TPA: hypothetical protein OYG76_002195 [Staphylococcus aureus]|nr:hypothetical protein [Staphylococcus aureus]
MLDHTNKSVKRVFKYRDKQELLNKYHELLDKYFLHNISFYEEDKNNECIYGLVVHTKNKLGDEDYERV